MKHTRSISPTTIRRITTLGLAAGASFVLLSACGEDEGSEPGHCPATDLDGTPVAAEVHLLDGTVSEGSTGPHVAAIVDRLGEIAADEPVQVSVGSFGGTAAQVEFARCLDGVVLRPEGNNANTREANLPDLLESVQMSITGLPFDRQASDPLSAIDAGLARMRNVPTDDRTLVVWTDGLATSGCAALPDPVDVDDDTLVQRLTDACRAEGAIPDGVGTTIVITGIGRTAVDLSDDAVDLLEDLMVSLCAATGAECHVGSDVPLPGA
jgi:hypothetical protein